MVVRGRTPLPASSDEFDSDGFDSDGATEPEATGALHSTDSATVGERC